MDLESVIVREIWECVVNILACMKYKKNDIKTKLCKRFLLPFFFCSSLELSQHSSVAELTSLFDFFWATLMT